MLGLVARTVKDGALSLALKTWLNERFGDFGQVTDCVLDTEAGRLMLEAKLKGERELLVATLEHFELVRDNGQAFMVLHEFSSSREWLSLLLARLFSGKRYPLPAAVAAML